MWISPVVRQIDTLEPRTRPKRMILDLKMFNGEGDDVQREQGKNVLLGSA